MFVVTSDLCINFLIASWLRIEINSIYKYVQITMQAVGIF